MTKKKQKTECLSTNSFTEGNVTEVKEIKKEIRSELKKAKLAYKDKIEAELSSNNLKEAWRGMKLMTGRTDEGLV